MMQSDMERASERKAQENRPAAFIAPSTTKSKPGPNVQAANVNNSTAADFPPPASFDDSIQLHNPNDSKAGKTFSGIANAIKPAASNVLKRLTEISDPTNSHH
ncbi:hypothetical protein Ddc_03716 [Ditylenchus destructor]|nr:hypothetical protein Ddc_03716 [Ditylenchus destructor]